MERLTYREKTEYGINDNIAYCDHERREIINRLAEYEDAVENGDLYKMPCKVGAYVWVIAKCKDVETMLDASYENATGYYCPYDMYNKCPYNCSECEDVEDKLTVFEDIVETITIEAYGIFIGTKYTNTVSSIGDLVFLDQEAAANALAERVLQQ